MRARFRCAAPLALAGALLSLAAPARPDVALQVSPGIERFGREGSATPIVVRVTGTYRASTGRIEVASRMRTGVRSASMPFRFSGAAIDQTATLLLDWPGDPSAETIVRVVADGRTVAQKKVEGLLTVSDDQAAIIVLTQDQSGLYAIAGRDMGYGHRGVPADQYRNQWNYPSSGNRAVPHAPRVVYPRPGVLPDTYHGYDAADVVVLGDMPLDALTDRQWDALTGWVQDGGTLVVSGGPDLPRLRRKELADILPMAPAGVRTVQGLGELAGAYHMPGPGGPIPITTGALRPGAVVLAGSSATPLVVAGRLGQGFVFFTTFDLLARDMRSWGGQPALWRQVLSYAAGDYRVRSVLAAAGDRDYRHGYYGGYETGRGLVDALAGKEATEAPGFAFIGFFLLLYIVLLVPVNYLLLRKWDKKELAWITAPAIIGAFTVGAYGVGYSLKGATLFLRHATVVEGAANADRFASYSVATLFSPAQRRYNVAVADPEATAEEVTDYLGGMQDNPDLAVSRGDRTVIDGALVNMWDHRTFGFSARADLGGRIEATTTRTASAIEVDITNNTRHALEECLVVAGSARVNVGSLPVGASKTATLPADPAPWSQPSLQVGALPGKPGSETAISLAMSAALNQSGASTAGNVPMVLLGWTRDNLAGIGLAGDKPVIQGASLVVVHLPPGGAKLTAFAPAPPLPSSAQAAPPNGVAMGPGGRVYYGGSMMSGPNYAQASSLNAEAYRLANSGQLDLALQTAKRAVRLAPTDANITDTLAEMYQRKGSYKQAAVFYKKALQLPGGQANPETHEKYGETLAKLGRKQEAVAQLQIAARSGDTWGARAQAALQQLQQAKKR